LNRKDTSPIAKVFSCYRRSLMRIRLRSVVWCLPHRYCLAVSQQAWRISPHHRLADGLPKTSCAIQRELRIALIGALLASRSDFGGPRLFQAGIPFQASRLHEFGPIPPKARGLLAALRIAAPIATTLLAIYTHSRIYRFAIQRTRRGDTTQAKGLQSLLSLHPGEWNRTYFRSRDR